MKKCLKITPSSTKECRQSSSKKDAERETQKHDKQYYIIHASSDLFLGKVFMKLIDRIPGSSPSSKRGNVSLYIFKISKICDKDHRQSHAKRSA